MLQELEAIVEKFKYKKYKNVNMQPISIKENFVFEYNNNFYIIKDNKGKPKVLEIQVTEVQEL